MGNQAKHLAAKPCILQALLFFAYCSLQASSKTFTLSEDGSLQVEGYNVNTVFGNVTAVGDLRVDGGSIKLLHADMGTTFQMMENTTDSVAFRSSRSTSSPILSLHTRNLDHSVHVAGKLHVDGVLQVDSSSSALKVGNMIYDPAKQKWIGMKVESWVLRETCFHFENPHPFLISPPANLLVILFSLSTTLVGEAASETL